MVRTSFVLVDGGSSHSTLYPLLFFDIGEEDSRRQAPFEVSRRAGQIIFICSAVLHDGMLYLHFCDAFVMLNFLYSMLQVSLIVFVCARPATAGQICGVLGCMGSVPPHPRPIIYYV